MAIEKGKEKVDSLEQFLLNCEVDLSKEKPQLLQTEEGLVHAADAWTTAEAGIRAVIESRAMELRHKILFTCQPVELPSLRERLVELGQVITLFKTAKENAARLAKQKSEKSEADWDAAQEDPEELDDETEDNSSM